MEAILEYIQSNVLYAPYIICGLLLLAGFNLPVSEDAMIFISGLLAAKFPEKKYLLFAGLFIGAYGSDLICYSLGRKFGPAFFRIKWFSKMVTPEKVVQISNYYAKYGIITLLLGRFIPFGVRNALFLSAGLARMNALKFALSDLLACSISNITMFTLVYLYGQVVMEYVKQGNKVIFTIFIIVLLTLFIKKKRNKSKEISETN